MDRAGKAAVVEEVAEQISASEAVFAINYRGLTVTQAAELRTRLADADATFRIVKNTLSLRAADQAGAPELKEYLEGPTAFAFVRGDAALAAKAVTQFARTASVLEFKGGSMNGDALSAEQLQALSRLPSKDVLYGQLVGTIAHPISGLARTMNELIAGLARQLSQVAEQKPAA